MAVLSDSKGGLAAHDAFKLNVKARVMCKRLWLRCNLPVWRLEY